MTPPRRRRLAIWIDDIDIDTLRGVTLRGDNPANLTNLLDRIGQEWNDAAALETDTPDPPRVHKADTLERAARILGDDPTVYDEFLPATITDTRLTLTRIAAALRRKATP